MRTLFLSLLCLFGALTVLQAQDSSYGIAYQAVARDADGDPLADVELGVRVTLRDADGNSLWQEEHASVLTNQFGNIALTIGDGVAASGSGNLGDLDWSAVGLHFEIEVNAGAGYASFGDVNVQAVPVALYAAGGWEGDVDALYSAIDDVEGDLAAYVSTTNATLTTLSDGVAANEAAIADEASARADEDAVLLGLIQGNDGDISILQTNVASNTADLGDILSVLTFGDGIVSIAEGDTLMIDGTLDLSGGSFSAGTGLFNYLSASNADFEEMSAESGLFEDLRFFNGRGFGPDSHLDLDGTLNVDGDAVFNASVSGTDGELASQNYVDGAVAAEAAARAAADAAIQADVDQNEADSDSADAAIQADVDQNEADSDSADAQLQANIDAEATARATADAAIQADVDQNEADSDSADAAIQADVDQNEADSDSADAAIQADVDQNEADSDSADAAIQADVDQNEADSDAADADLQGQINDNEFRIGAAAADMGFETTTVGGVDNTPAHPGYTGTNHLDGESTLVGADEALDAAIQAETERALAAEGQNASDIAQNASDIADNEAAIIANDGDIADLQTALQDEITRATGAEAAIQGDVDQNEADSDAADAQLQTNINAVQADVDQNEADSDQADADLQADIDQNELDSDTADAQLQSNIDDEAQARETADNTLQSNIDAEATARANADADLQGQIDSNDTDITNLQNGLNQEVADRIYAQQQLNFGIQNNQGAILQEAETRETEDGVLLDLINELQGDVVDGGVVDAYFDHAGSSVEFNDAMFSEISMNEGDLVGVGNIVADQMDAAVIDVDDAAIQNLDVESNLTAEAASVSNLLTTQEFRVFGDSQMDGDLSVAGAVDFDSTLTVAGETTLNDNTVINGDLTVNGNVTANEATMSTHLPTYGQVTFIADTLQDNIDAEEAARIAADNNLQNQITSNDTDISNLDSRVTVNEGDIVSLEGRMDIAEGDIDGLEVRMGTAEGDIDSLEGRVTTNEGNISDLQGRMGTAEGEIDQLQLDVVEIADTLQANIDAEESARIAADGNLQTQISGNDTDISALQSEDIALNGRADSLATAVASNDTEILDLQGRMTTAEGDISDLETRADSLAGAVASNDTDIENLDIRVTANEGDISDLETRADSLAGAVASNDTDISNLQAEDIILHGRADSLAGAVASNDTDIANLQTELDDTQAGAGLNTDGSYAGSTERWIDDATSLANADDQLAAAADSIEQVLYWNKEVSSGYDPIYGNNYQLELDPDIDRLYLPDVNVVAHTFSAASSVSANQGTFETIDADEANLEEVSTWNLYAGTTDTDEIFWGDAEDNGPASTTYLHGTLTVDGVTTLNGYTDINDSLHVEDLARFEDDVYIDGALDVDGVTTLNDSLHVDGGAGFGDDIWVAGNSQLDGALNVDGASTLNSTLDVDGATTLNSTLDVDGASTLNNTLDVDGATTLNNTLDVDGATTLNDSLHVDLGAGFGSDIWVAGNSNVSGNSQVDGDLNVDGATTLNSTLDVDGASTLNSTLDVDGASTLNSTLDVDGTTTLNDSLHVDLGAGFGDDIWVAGNSDVAGNSQIDGTLNVDGAATLNSTLDVDGITDLNDSLHVVGNADFDANVNVDGNLNVDGVTVVDSLNASEGVDFESTLNVDGTTTLNDSLHVDMGAGFASNVWIDGTLDVDGATTLNNTLDVDGAGTFNSTLDVDGNTTLDTTYVEEYFDASVSNAVISATENVSIDGDTLSLDAESLVSLYSDSVLYEGAPYRLSESVLSADASIVDVDAAGLAVDAAIVDATLAGANVDLNAVQLSGSILGNGSFAGYVDVDVVTGPEVLSILGNINGLLGTQDADVSDVLPLINGFLGSSQWIGSGDVSIQDALPLIAGLESLVFGSGSAEFQNFVDTFGLDGDLESQYLALLYDAASGTIGGAGSYLADNTNGSFIGGMWADSLMYIGENAGLLIESEMHLYADSLVADAPTNLQQTLEVDGITDLNDSLHVVGNADFDANVNIDFNLNVDGVSTVDSLNAAEGVDFDSTLNVDGITDLNDSLHVVGNADFDANVNIDGMLTVRDSAQFDDNVNIDATLTADSAIVEESLKIYTPTYDEYSFSSETLSEPEFEILNVDGDPIFEVDGHNDDVIAENLTVNGTFTTQDWIVNDDISADDISAAGVVTSGNTTFGSEWGTANANGNNWLTRRDYVDFHRQAATGVIQAFSYDADLIGGAAGADYNEAVYYMNGDLVLYADSVESANSKNYTITVKGENFNSLIDEDGAPLTIEAAIWAENNKLDITAASHNLSVVDDNTITFEIGYGDINGIVACTSGKVRPTLALGSDTYGMQMTGLHFFIEIEEAVATPE